MMLKNSSAGFGMSASLYFHSAQEGYRWRVDDPIACMDNYQRLMNDSIYQGTTL
jgi:hypothetical protein